MKKILTCLAAAFLVVFIVFSCKNSNNTDEDDVVAVSQDKENIKTTITGFYNCLNKLNDGDFSNFILYSLFNSGNSEFNETWTKNLFDKFETQFGGFIVDEKFQFATRSGIYSWNNTSKKWVKDSNSTVITLKFPSKSGITTNDTEITLSNYSDAKAVYGTDTVWLPKLATLSLKRNGNEVFSLNLSNVTFEVGTNFTMPLSADINIFTAPFTNKITWRRNTSKDFQFLYTSSNSEGCGWSILTNVTLNNTDYGNISALTDFKTINGTITEGALSINYSMNVGTLASYNDPTPEQINANTKAEAFYDGKKVGDLIYKRVNNRAEIFIVYSDGTSENVDVYVSDFEKKIRSIFANYIH